MNECLMTPHNKNKWILGVKSQIACSQTIHYYYFFKSQIACSQKKKERERDKWKNKCLK